jgi:hypothetical protein
MFLILGLLGVEYPVDICSYSGTPFHLAHFLRKRGHDVRKCGSFPLRHRSFLQMLDRFYRRLTGKHFVCISPVPLAMNSEGFRIKTTASNVDSLLKRHLYVDTA